MTDAGTTGTHEVQARTVISLAARAERRLIRPTGSFRHIDFALKVSERAAEARYRTPLSLALVLDRSGSMHGDKLATAKQAALSVLDLLDERDRVSVVVFDNQIDVLQPAGPATPELKQRVKDALCAVHARANTALHEGWLVGCKSIAAEEALDRQSRLSRCFLLTDGLANVGLTEPEKIASDAAGVRDNAGIGTSTFGIGPDYDEGLLGPMAVAGGGQFHHLRTAEDIAKTFVGELGELLTVVARQVRLEIALGPGMGAEMVSEYWAKSPEPGAMEVTVGDLLAGEERHLVVRFSTPQVGIGAEMSLRARVVWVDDGQERCSEWEQVGFSVAEHAACDAEKMDPQAMHWVGLHHAQRAKREALDLSRQGNLEGARARLRGVIKRLKFYAGGDPDLVQALQELKQLERELKDKPLDVMYAKEAYYSVQLQSRMQRDKRT